MRIESLLKGASQVFCTGFDWAQNGVFNGLAHFLLNLWLSRGAAACPKQFVGKLGYEEVDEKLTARDAFGRRGIGCPSLDSRLRRSW